MTDRELMQQALGIQAGHNIAATVFVYRHRTTGEVRCAYLGDMCEMHPNRDAWDHLATLEPRMWIEAHYAKVEALEQPEQEPVAHLWQHSETGRTRIVMPDQIVTADATWHVVGPLYLTPPRREWVGLTMDDMADLAVSKEWLAGARWAEAKLREKSHV